MFKKLREKIYNRKIEKELAEIEYFDTVCNGIYSIHLSFIKYHSKNDDVETFKPQTVYAIKRAIQKLSANYIITTSATHFEKILDRAFKNAGFDESRIKECLNLFISMQNRLNENKKEELIER